MKHFFAWMAAALLLAGCATSGRAPAPATPPAPATAPAPTAPAPTSTTPAAPAAPLTPVTGAPVDWAPFALDGAPPSAPITANACETSANGGLITLSATDVRWAPYPLARDPFLTPSLVVVICNGGTTKLSENLQLATLGPNGERWVSSVPLPSLEPGQAAGPLRIFSESGVPKAVPLPKWTLEFDGKAFPLEAETTDTKGPLTLEQMQARAWSRRLDNGREFFLYAPDAEYSVQTSPYCGAAPGQLNASARHWSIWTATVASAPAKLLDIGESSFEGGRGLELLPAPALKTTFLLLGHYGSCANPTYYEMYAYDQASGQVYRPKLNNEQGREPDATVGGSVELTPESKLTWTSYNNAGDDAGWHTYTYVWQDRTWVFESHQRKQ